MKTSAVFEDQFRTGKVYTIRQAAHLAGVSQGTVRNWLFGSTPKRGYSMEPVFGDKERTSEAARVSFLELSELVIAARFRRLNIRLQRIRLAHEFARKEWKVPYPFAHFELTSIGGHILRKFEEQAPSEGPRFVVLSSPDQVVLPDLVIDETENFDYSPIDKFAERWHLFGRGIPVVVDPRFAGGEPTIEGRGVRVEILRRRWKAGESFADIARDFRLKPVEVEAVLQKVA
jgi:uncharacterized protein (DUF433 family)